MRFIAPEFAPSFLTDGLQLRKRLRSARLAVVYLGLPGHL
jgi:hypothetical protein